MKELLEQRERLAAVAKQKIETVILPRVEELARHFDNAKVVVLHTDADYNCVCEFVHTPRFPANVRLGIALLPEKNENLTARYDLNILPVLMEYNRSAEEIFPLGDDEEPLAGWVDDRILEFIDTYLRLETHPFYQKDNTVLDIVCGMMGSQMPQVMVTSGSTTAVDVNRYRAMMGMIFSNMSSIKGTTPNAQPAMSDLMSTMTTALSDMPMTSTDQPFRNMSSAFREGMMGGATGGMMR